jgi:hypothetical protein
MDANLLTTVERAGGRAVLDKSATLEERNALATHLIALRAAGHLLAADEVTEYGEPSGAIRVTHFLTCEACKKGVF